MRRFCTGFLLLVIILTFFSSSLVFGATTVPVAQERALAQFIAEYRGLVLSKSSKSDLARCVSDFLNERYSVKNKFTIDYVEDGGDSLALTRYLNQLSQVVMGLDYTVYSGFADVYSLFDIVTSFSVLSAMPSYIQSVAVGETKDTIGVFFDKRIYFILKEGVSSDYACVAVHESAHAVDFVGGFDVLTDAPKKSRLSELSAEGISGEAERGYAQQMKLNNLGVAGFPTSYSRSASVEFLAECVAQYIVPTGVLNKYGDYYNPRLESVYLWVDSLLNTTGTVMGLSK